MYDVIVIGARCAGAPSAMLLAQKGYRVLLVDRARFPSDTLSTHQVQVKGGDVLMRWGLWDKVLSTNCPPVENMAFNIGTLNFHGKIPPLNKTAAIVCPRRTLLDKILVDAAMEAGAELREDLIVEQLLISDGVVTGIRGRIKSTSHSEETQVSENARLVIGADGKRSLVARTMEAPEYHARAAATCAYYTYWEGLDAGEGHIYALPQATVGIWPTNDRLAIIYTGYPVSEFQEIRRDVERRFWKTMAELPGISERLHSGRKIERFYGTADLPSFYRRPYGPGWALVGDAGMTLDPITGQGIGNAFRDAERLAQAVDSTLCGRMAYDAAMAAYEQERNAETLPMYEFTSQLAAFNPPSLEQQLLFAALAKKPGAADQFFGFLTGSVPVQTFFSPPNLLRILGAAGMGRIMINKLTGAMQARKIRALT